MITLSDFYFIMLVNVVKNNAWSQSDRIVDNFRD